MLVLDGETFLDSEDSWGGQSEVLSRLVYLRQLSPTATCVLTLNGDDALGGYTDLERAKELRSRLVNEARYLGWGVMHQDESDTWDCVASVCELVPASCRSVILITSDVRALFFVSKRLKVVLCTDNGAEEWDDDRYREVYGFSPAMHWFYYALTMFRLDPVLVQGLLSKISLDSEKSSATDLVEQFGAGEMLRGFLPKRRWDEARIAIGEAEEMRYEKKIKSGLRGYRMCEGLFEPWTHR